MDETLSPVETYLREAEELLADIEETVLDLEQSPDNSEYLNRLFRAFHTIKGSGSMFGFDDIAALTHHVETLLDHVRQGNMAVTGKLINLILISKDHIRAMLNVAADETAESPDSEKLIATLQKLIPEPERPEESPPAFPLPDEKGPDGRKSYHIRFRPHPKIMKNGMEPSLVLNELRGMGECSVTVRTGAVPALDRLIPEQCYLSWDIFLTTVHEVNTVKDVFIFVEADSRVTIDEIPPDEISPEKPEEAISSPPAPRPETEVRDKQADLSPPKEPERPPPKTTVGTVRIPSGKLDHLINLVGELVITQAHISQILTTTDRFEDIRSLVSAESEQLSARLQKPVETLEQVTGELRDCALNMRMLPIGTIFGKFRRLVRDLSARLGKEVRLITEGAETELDKTLIEHLNDPLVHLIRNSISHGIQSPEKREHMGKPREGTVRLSASHQGANVIITVEDDGMGMDPEKIRAKALEKGVISEEEKLSEEEIWPLIFLPGFSTARQVTGVSGRGVGMDVVKRGIESLGGSVQISSQKGQYLRIRLILPLTLAIIDGLQVRVGSEFFVLPLAHVVECAELTADMTVKRSGQRHITQIRGELIPLIRLRDIFDIPGSRSCPEYMAVVEVENFRVGIVADELIGSIQAVIKSLGRKYGKAESISGATIMGDGTVALIVDIPALVRIARHKEEKSYST